MAFDLAMVLGFLIVSGLALAGLLALGWLLRPKKPTRIKATTYECGERPFGPAWFNFNNRFYVIALIFVVFDVEVALIVPVAVVFHALVDAGYGLLAFAEMVFFLAILFVALIYVWARNDLSWIKEVAEVKQQALASAGKEQSQ